MRVFSAPPLHYEVYQWHHKSAVPSMLLSVEATGKKTNGARPVGVGPEFDTLHFAKKNLE